jgi:hypothetical protein
MLLTSARQDKKHRPPPNRKFGLAGSSAADVRVEDQQQNTSNRGQ